MNSRAIPASRQVISVILPRYQLETFASTRPPPFDETATAWGDEAIERTDEKMPNYLGTHIIPGAGHWIQQECPDETNRLLLDFLGKLAS
jgi:pimeloyl-ACP methyl ester carboxylesterase